MGLTNKIKALQKMPIKKKGTLYFVNRLHEEPITRPTNTDDFIVVSVDPGVKNFALLVERRSISTDGKKTTAKALFLDKWDLNPALKVGEKKAYGYHEHSATKSCFNIQDEVRIYYNLNKKLDTLFITTIAVVLASALRLSTL